MSDFAQITADALDILNYDGAVQDTLAELRRKWGGQVPALLDERFDTVGVQYMQLPHEKGVAALGQELSAFGWALYDLDGDNIYLFVLIPQSEREDFEALCKQQGRYCRLMKQPGRKWGDHAKERDPGKVMPCEEYTLGDEYDYFFNSLAGDFAAGEWKPQDGENWLNGCVADLRRRPPQVTRAKSLPKLCSLSYSLELDVYGAARSGGSDIGRVLVGKNPANLNWFEPSPIGYNSPPRSLRWIGNSLWVGGPLQCHPDRTDPTGAPARMCTTGSCPRTIGAVITTAASRGRSGPGILFQPMVQRDHLPMGKRPGHRASLPAGRI